jgi:2-hydroxyacyl-CoA lyase 1
MVVGDSAFGFSGMEMETAARYKLPLKVIIINNNGIGMGVESIEKDATPADIPVGALSPDAKYEMISVAFGGKGASVSNHKALADTLKEMLSDNNLWVLNVHIDPTAGRKQQEFSWLTRKEDDPKQTDAKL